MYLFFQIIKCKHNSEIIKAPLKLPLFYVLSMMSFCLQKTLFFFGRNAHTPNSFYVMKHFTVLSQCSGNERARTCTLNWLMSFIKLAHLYSERESWQIIYWRFAHPSSIHEWNLFVLTIFSVSGTVIEPLGRSATTSKSDSRSC